MRSLQLVPLCFVVLISTNLLDSCGPRLVRVLLLVVDLVALTNPSGHARIAGLGVALISSLMPGVDIDRFFHGAAPELVDPKHFGWSNTGAMKASDVYAFAVLSWEVSMEFTMCS